MNAVFKILLIIFLVLFVITLLIALIQGIRIKNKSSKTWGLFALVMAIFSVGSFWGVSASNHSNSNESQAINNSSSAKNDSSNSSGSTSSSANDSSKSDSQKKASESSSVSQMKQNQSEKNFESRDRRNRDMANRRQEQMLAKRGTDKKGYEKQISGVPDQSSHVVEKVTYDGNDKTVVTISSDLTMGNRRENQHNAFTVWSGIKRIAYLHHVKTNVIIKDHKGKEIANTSNNRFNYLE